jgi:hypothetical protein
LEHEKPNAPRTNDALRRKVRKEFSPLLLLMLRWYYSAGTVRCHFLQNCMV